MYDLHSLVLFKFFTLVYKIDLVCLLTAPVTGFVPCVYFLFEDLTLTVFKSKPKTLY